MRTGHCLLIACIVLGIGFLSSLGFWQLSRLAQKEAMIARVEEGVKLPPRSVEEIEALKRSGGDIEYHPAIAEGRFDHTKEQHYFATYKGSPGYFVYTPLKLEDDRVLFINRGFVPMMKKEQEGRREGLVTGLVRIEGLARSAPDKKPNSFVPNNDLSKNVFYWKSLPQMAGRAFDKTEIEIVGFFLDADSSEVPGGSPIGGVTRLSFPNNHLQYALTWFGLAGALLVVGGMFVASRMRRQSSQRH